MNLTTMNRKAKSDDVNTILGDFTTINLLNIDIKNQESFIDNAKSIQAELIENMEHDLFTGVEVLRELRKAHTNKDYFLPIVFTSSIGAIDNQFDYLDIGDCGISQTPQVFLDCQVMEINGDLQINWDIRKGIFPTSLIENAMEKYLDSLKILVNDMDWNKPFYIDPLTDEERNKRVIINKTKSNYEIRALHLDVLHPNIYVSG